MRDLSLCPFSGPVCLLALALGAGVSLQAQAVKFQNFRNYPQGQYRQEGRSTMNGKAVGQPTVDTLCAAPLSPQGYAAVKQIGDQAGAMNSCSVKVLKDTSATAEYVQTCNPGATETVIHSTMHSVDDRTMTMDIEMSVSGQPTIESHIKSTYLGVCPAGTTQPGIPVMLKMPKPSKEECAEIAESKRQMNDGANSCSDMPAEYKARCEAAMKTARQQMQMVEAACK